MVPLAAAPNAHSAEHPRAAISPWISGRNSGSYVASKSLRLKQIRLLNMKRLDVEQASFNNEKVALNIRHSTLIPQYHQTFAFPKLP